MGNEAMGNCDDETGAGAGRHRFVVERQAPELVPPGMKPGPDVSRNEALWLGVIRQAWADSDPHPDLVTFFAVRALVRRCRAKHLTRRRERDRSFRVGLGREPLPAQPVRFQRDGPLTFASQGRVARCEVKLRLELNALPGSAFATIPIGKRRRGGCARVVACRSAAAGLVGMRGWRRREVLFPLPARVNGAGDGMCASARWRQIGHVLWRWSRAGRCHRRGLCRFGACRLPRGSRG